MYSHTELTKIIIIYLLLSLPVWIPMYMFPFRPPQCQQDFGLRSRYDKCVSITELNYSNWWQQQVGRIKSSGENFLFANKWPAANKGLMCYSFMKRKCLWGLPASCFAKEVLLYFDWIWVTCRNRQLLINSVRISNVDLIELCLCICCAPTSVA